MKSTSALVPVWLITVLLLLSFTQTAQAAGVPGLQLSASPSRVLPGQQVVVDVLVKNAPLIYGAEARLSFDPNRLEVVDADLRQAGVQISPGNFFDPAHSFTLLNQVDNTTGEIKYAVTLINPAPAVERNGLLTRVTFLAKAPGQTTVSIVYGMFGTKTGETIAPELSSVNILIDSKTTTRTPKPKRTLTAIESPLGTATSTTSVSAPTQTPKPKPKRTLPPTSTLQPFNPSPSTTPMLTPARQDLLQPSRRTILRLQQPK